MRTFKDIHSLIEAQKEKKGKKTPEDPVEIITTDDEDETLEKPELDTDRPKKPQKPNPGPKGKNAAEAPFKYKGAVTTGQKEGVEPDGEFLDEEDNIDDNEVEDILSKMEQGEIPDPDIDVDDDEEEDEDSDWAEYVELGEQQDWDDMYESLELLDEAIIRKRVFRRDRKTGAIKRVLKLVSSNPRAKVVGGKEKIMSPAERRKRAIAAKRRGRKKGVIRKASRKAKMTRRTRLGMKG